MIGRLVIALGTAVIVVGLLTFFFISSKPQNPVIRVNEDRCDKCGMVISDIRYAAMAYYKPENRWVKFDDVGELFAFIYDNGGVENFGEIYVFDYMTQEMIDGRKAYYVVAPSDKLWTPMSTGVVALKHRDDALSIASQYNGDVMTFDEMLNWISVNRENLYGR